MKRDFEVIVLGLGGIGSAAAYWLSRRLGDEVLGLEQFALDHDRGSSQDHSRIIRYSYHSPAYVRLAALAYETWAAVEAESGRELVVKTGGLDLFPIDGAISRTDYTASLEEVGVGFELLEAAEVRRRWPQFRIDDDTMGLFQEDGGLVRAADANNAHRNLARRRGAVLRATTPVEAIRAVGGEVQVTTGEATFRTARLVIAAGAWTPRALSHFGLSLPLTVTREQVVYLSPTGRAELSGDRLPIWIWMDEPCYYGFPEIDGRGLKLAQDVGGEEADPESRSFAPDAANLDRVRRFADRLLRTGSATVDSVKTCLYTLTPDRDFIVDRLPSADNCLLAVGAGHAFKFASALGHVLAEMALDGRTTADLEPFRADRNILQQEDPPRSFII